MRAMSLCGTILLMQNHVNKTEEGWHMHFGFSYMGLIFLVMLTAPNLIWTKNKPIDYDKYVINENKLLLVLERVGEVFVTCLALIFSDFNTGGISLW